MSSAEFHAIYSRLSKALNGQVDKVERQERRGRAYAEAAIAEGRWADLPVRVFRDNDRSAWKEDVQRPGYDDLRAAVRDGKVARIWTVEQTRLEANRKRWVELVAELDDAGIEVIDTDRDGLVRLDEVADIKHILSWHERQRLSRRVNDTLADLAGEGRPSGSSSFGYRHVKAGGRVWLKVEETEAAELRQAADAVLVRGWSATAVARDLENRKVATRRGGRWRHTTVRSMLTSPTVAGKRVHQGQIVGEGDWEPILDEMTWRRLVAHFDQRSPRRQARRYLLSGGLTICGRCKGRLAGKLASNGKRRPDGGRYRREIYICSPVNGGCGRLVVGAKHLDVHVTGVLLGHLDSEQFRTRIAAGDVHAAERERLSAALAELDVRRRKAARRWARGDLEESEWDEMRQEFAQEKAQLNAALAAVPAPVVDVDPDEVVEDWEEMTTDEQRHTLGIYLSKVVVNPTNKRGRGFDAGRVEIYEANGDRLR